MKPLLHLSLHDVAPLHLTRLARAEALFTEVGATRVTYLLVPDFHNKGQADLNPGFVDFCRQPRPFTVEWFLHGYYHRETQHPTAPVDATPPLGQRLRNAWARQVLTGGEGEFLALPDDQAVDRIRRGIAVFAQTLGFRPSGFVPPAWLYRTSHHALLQQEGIRWSEDHHGIFDLTLHQRLASRAITWATRTSLRKASSLIGAPLLARWQRSASLLRVAIHPHDFDHPATVASICSLIRRLVREREQVTIGELPSAGGLGWRAVSPPDSGGRERQDLDSGKPGA